MKLLTLITLAFCTIGAYGQVRLTWRILENGNQRYEAGRTPDEVVISVSRQNPRAYVWLSIEAEAPAQHFDTFSLALDCGDQFDPAAKYAVPWTGRSLWWYTNHPFWWYPTYWYAPADALTRGTQMDGRLFDPGDSRWVGLIQFSCLRGPGEYVVTPLGSTYWYWPTSVKYRGVERPLRMDRLRIIVR